MTFEDMRETATVILDNIVLATDNNGELDPAMRQPLILTIANFAQASRQAAIEEAARICSGLVEENFNGPYIALLTAEQKIRALARPDPDRGLGEKPKDL